MTQDTDRLSITNLRAMAQHSVECYRESYQEAFNIHEYYHGRQLSARRIENMNKANIPHMSDNLIKKYASLVGGHFTTVVNTIKINAQQENDVELASILHDLVNFDFRRNAFDTDQGQEVVLQGILTGLFSITRMPVDTGDKDEFGRPIYANQIEHVPVYDLILDPNSSKFDYSDAEWVTRVQWLSENKLRKAFPELTEEDILNLPRGGNSIGGDTADRLDRYGNDYNSISCGNSDKFHLVHTVIVDGETEDGRDKVWSIYWCGDMELERKEVSYRNVKFPYQIFKLYNEDTEHEFYGLFRDCLSHQDAVNNAMLALHRLIGTGKIAVKIGATGATEDMNKLNRDWIDPNVGIIQLKDLNSIKNLVNQEDVNNQLSIIEFHRRSIESQLGINPAFLGVSAASDSGRKVQIQRQSTVTALNKTERRVQQFYRQLARDLCHFISQYYTFHQVYNVADTSIADKFVEINRPVEILVDTRTGQTVDIQQTAQGIVFNGQLIDEAALQEIIPHIQKQMVFEKVLDPASGKEIVNEKGENVYAPIPTRGSEIRYFRHDIIVDTSIYDNEREVAMNFARDFYAGSGGQLVAQMNPAAYILGMAKLARGLKTKATNEVADIFEATAAQSQAPTNAVGSSPRPSETEPQ